MKLKYLQRFLLPFFFSAPLFSIDQTAGILMSDFNTQTKQNFYLETYENNLLKLSAINESVSEQFESLLGKHVVAEGKIVKNIENETCFNVQSIIENLMIGKSYETIAPVSSFRVHLNEIVTDTITVEIEGLFEDMSYELKKVVVQVHPEEMLVELRVIATTHDGIRGFQMVPYKTVTEVKSLSRRGAYRLVVNEKMTYEFILN